MNRIEVEQRTILVGLAGSHGYGLNHLLSDMDSRGVFIAPKKFIWVLIASNKKILAGMKLVSFRS